MKFKTKCPCCDKDIGIVTIIIALTPFTFKCMKCGTRIYIKGIFKWIIINLMVMGGVAIYFLRVLFDMGVLERKQYIYLLGPVFVIVASEVIRCLLVCNKARLEYKDKKKKES